MMVFAQRFVLLSTSIACTGLIFDRGVFRGAVAQAEAETFLSAPSFLQAGSELEARSKKYFEDREYKLAIASSLELLKLEPDNATAYNTLGMSFGELKEYSAAIAAFERAIALDKNFANAYYHRGHIYQQLGKYELALTDFDRTLKLTNDRHLSALINRASIRALQEDYHLALTDLQQAIDINPKSAIAYYNRALIQLTIGNKTAYLNDLTIAEQLYRQQGDTAGLTQINRIKQLY